VVDHKEAIAQFANYLNDILQFLLLPGAISESASPTKKEAGHFYYGASSKKIAHHNLT
jgi:hypothetical protein